MQLTDLGTSAPPAATARSNAGGPQAPGATDFDAAMAESLADEGEELASPAESADAPEDSAIVSTPAPASDAHSSLAALVLSGDAPDGAHPGETAVAAAPGMPQAEEVPAEWLMPLGAQRSNGPGATTPAAAAAGDGVKSGLPGTRQPTPTWPDAQQPSGTARRDHGSGPPIPTTATAAVPATPQTPPDETAEVARTDPAQLLQAKIDAAAGPSAVPDAASRAPSAHQPNGAIVATPTTMPELDRARVDLPPQTAAVANAAVAVGGPQGRAGRASSVESRPDLPPPAEQAAQPSEPMATSLTRLAATATDIGATAHPARPGARHYGGPGVFPGESPAGVAAPPQALDPAPTAMPATAIVERGVVPQIVHSVHPGVAPGTIDVTLDPPELGRVEIVIELADQTLRATLAAERPATGELLRRHLDLLAEQFRDAGFSEINLGFASHRDSHHRSDGRGAVMIEASVEERAAIPAARPVRLATAGTGAMDLRF